jgi:hypothetical protein
MLQRGGPALPRAARKEISLDMGGCGRLANDPVRGAGVT